MSTTKSILGIIPGLQATALVSHNLKLIPKVPTKKVEPRKQIKKFVKTGVGTIVGINLIKPTAKLINAL